MFKFTPFLHMKTSKLRLAHIEENGFHLLIEVKINNLTQVLVLDTGASKSVLDLSWSQEYITKKVQLEDETSVGNGGDQLSSYSIDIDLLEVGDLRIENYSIALLDLSHVKKSYEKLSLPNIIGVLGSDILKAYNAVIDYKNLKISFD